MTTTMKHKYNFFKLGAGNANEVIFSFQSTMYKKHGGIIQMCIPYNEKGYFYVD